MNFGQYSERLKQIKTKLELAKKHDLSLKTFGSDSHRYTLNPPLPIEEVIRFEEHYQITLPAEYKAFVTTLGNGGPGDYGGAGPYYGIYPLGDFGYLEPSAKHMKHACIINSKLTNEKWQRLIKFTDQFDDLSEAYEQKYDQLFSGLMFIGTQGCNFQTMLVLNGTDVGRVVYIDQDLQQPIFKENFLDWYETWLDNTLKI